MTTSRRRTQIVLLVAALVLCYILFFSSEADKGSDFKGKTEEALKRKHSILSPDLSDEEYQAQTKSELQKILDGKNGQELTIPDGTHGDEIPIAGRKMMPAPKQSPFQQVPAEKPKYPVKDDSNEANNDKDKKVGDPGEDMAREELMQIFKRSPIIIFSKSYCPHSKRAKQLLLHEYSIKPEPYVVELDLMTKVVPKLTSMDEDEREHSPDVTLGRKLQDLLLSLTGRKTVPNIMVSTQSIGGASEVVQMDSEGTLIDKIQKLGGKRITSIVKLD